MFKKAFQKIREKLSVFASEPKSEVSSNVLFISIISGIILTTFAFAPLFGVNGLVIKNLLLPIFAGIVIIIVAVQSLKQGYFVISDKKSFAAISLFLGIMLISSLFADSSRNALFGGFENAPSFIFLFSLVVFFYIASVSLKKFSRIFGLLMTVSAVYIVIFLHYILRIIFGAQFLSFGVLNSITSSLAGTWIDFSVLSLLIVIFAVICLEIGKFVRAAKWITLGIGGLGVIGLFLTNISWVWILAGGILVITSVYLFSFAYWNPEKSSYEKGRVIPWYSLAAFLLVIVGILFGNFINSIIAQVRPIAYNEVAPTTIASIVGARTTIMEHPLFGTGLGSYDSVWNKIKPVSLSGTDVGSTEFTIGDSFIGTQLATVGIVGILAWLLVLGFLVYQYVLLFKNGFWNSADRFGATLIMSGSLIFSIVACIYYPSVPLLVIWMIFLGGLWAIIHSEEKRISFIHDPRTSFFGILVVLVLILTGGIMTYVSTRKIVSVFSYSSAIQSFSNSNRTAGAQYLIKANNAWFSDFYNRSLANQVLLEVQNLQPAQGANQDALTREVQRILSTGLSYADAATKLSPTNYRNWVTLGNVYQLFAELKVEGAVEKAQEAFTQAQKLSPQDATLDILSANLALVQGKTSEATQAVQSSINRWPTSDAFLWLYQRNSAVGNSTAAEQNLINAFQVDSNNAGIVAQLGLIYFNQGKYAQAIPAFQQSLVINRFQPLVFAYLGVSYELAGDSASANQIYEFLRKEIPDSAESLITQVKQTKRATLPEPEVVTDEKTTDAAKKN